MKKVIFTIIFSLIALSMFSLNMDDIKSYYTTYINEYESNSENLNWFFTELKNLGLYKFYKTQMVGSAEYTDRPSYISKHLSTISENHSFKSLEEEIAFSGFLAYVESKLSGKTLKEETIRSLPAFYLALEEYSSYLQDNGFLYIKNAIAYSLGLVKDSPNKTLIMKKMKNRKAELEFPEYYIYDGEADEFFDNIISKNKDLLEDGINEISKMMITGEDLEIEIDDLASRVLSFVPDTIKNDTQNIISIFLNNAKVEKSNEWIRFIIYIAIILAIYIMKKTNLYKWAFFVILISEVIYILFYYNFTKDMITSFIYGSFIFTAFLLTLIVLFFKAFGRNTSLLSRIINISFIIIIGFLFTIPLFTDVQEIKMENNIDFHNSPMQKELLNDTLIYPYSFVNKDVAYIGSQLSAEFSEIRNIYNQSLKKFLLDSGKNNILDYLTFEDGKVSMDLLEKGIYIDNIEVYKELTDNFRKVLEDFEKSSQKRYENIYNGLNIYNNHVANILKYSDKEFMDLFKNNLETKLIKSNVLINFKPNLLKVFSNEINSPINLKAIITDWGTKILILLIIGFLFFNLNETLLFKLTGLSIMVIASILSFIKPETIHILSEFKYPLLNANTFGINATFGLLMILFTALSGLKIIKFYKGR
ncbi:hypothetical protein [Marinitoga sp. 38H-ov]|uniref:hypothetical protein n=1 Tax=Marinitoga sp. 38H-ov TaxID=1755814 RepID=UPI0013EC9267|nr:hypothetical protein [Marinitoga sp. 38H-ov]KAF2956672.1 hypothetical protein AS160_04600 [Marinitoga sp. 38H-ov]